MRRLASYRFDRLFDVCMGKNQSKELCEKNAVNAAAAGDVMKAGGIRPKRFVSSRMKLLLAKKFNGSQSLKKHKHKGKNQNASSLRTRTRQFRKKLAVGALRNRIKTTNKRPNFPKGKIREWRRKGKHNNRPKIKKQERKGKNQKASLLRTRTRQFRKKLAVGALRNRKKKTNERRNFPKVKITGWLTKWKRNNNRPKIKKHERKGKNQKASLLRTRTRQFRKTLANKRFSWWRKGKRNNNRPKIKKQKMTSDEKWKGQLAAALKKTLHSNQFLRKQSNALDSTLKKLIHVRKGISPRRPRLKYRLTYSFVLPKKDSQVLFTLLHWQAINKGAKDIYSLADKHKKLLTKHGKLENESVFHFLKRKNVEMAFRSPFTRKVHEIYKKITKKGRTGWFLTKYFRKSGAKYKLQKALRKLNQYTKTRYYQVKKMLLRK